MISVSGSINLEDERRIAIHLEQLPRKLRSNLRPAIVQLTDQLLARIRAMEPVRTGRLRQATQSFIDEHEDRISGKVRVLAVPGRGRGSHNVAAAALEYGAHRSFTVQSHMERLSHVFGRPGDQHLVMVSAYNRRANIMAQRFLRSPAAAMRPQIEAELKRVVAESLR